jgi:mono/diheme cytochrome c family protein
MILIYPEDAARTAPSSGMSCRERHRILRRRVLQIALGGFVLTPLFLLAAGPRKSDDGPAAQLSKAPPSARFLQNPFAGQVEAIEAGHKLFQQHCAQCHGRDARGLGHAADLHSLVIQDAQPGVLFWALGNGRIRKGMPSWSQMPDEQLWQIVTYLKTLK